MIGSHLVCAERFDRPDTVLAQQVVQFRVDQLDTLPVGGGFLAGLNLQGEVEIVDDLQQLLEQVDDRLVGLLAPFAVDAFAIVVELCRFAQEPIVEVVALIPERGELR